MQGTDATTPSPAGQPPAGERSRGNLGRPRDPSRADAIREAALELVAEQGYDRVTVDAVAARAGASKATMYRRWRSKAQLVVDALADLQAVARPADTGSLRGDFDRVCAELTDEQEARTLAVMRGLASALPHDVELRAAFEEGFVAPRRAALGEIFARAVARGEVAPERDVELLASAIPAMMLHRILTGEGPPSPAFARHVVDELVIPAATAAIDRPEPEGSPR